MMNACSNSKRPYRGSEGEEVCGLCSLPDSVLAHILSFLPARDAARTCLLRSFGDLWTTIDTLHFDDSLFMRENRTSTAEDKFFRFVRSFLLLHNRSQIREFRLLFSEMVQNLAESGDGSVEETVPIEENEIGVWIKAALGRGGVKVLDLGFGLRYYEMSRRTVMIPRFVWINETLVELSLFNCDIELPKFVQMKALRVLKLSAIWLSSGVLREIMQGCQFLQDLSMSHCIYLDNELFIDLPNLRSLNFTGCTCHLKVMTSSSLKMVSLNLMCDDLCDEQLKFFVQFETRLNKFHHVELVKLNKRAFAISTYFVLKKHPFPRNKWKCVQLETWLNDKYLSGIHSLLKYSSNLEELIIEINDAKLQFPEDIESELDDHGNVAMNNDSLEWLMPCLKKVAMHGLFRSSLNAQIKLIKVILENAYVLDEFIIFAMGSTQPPEDDALTFDELFNVLKELLSFPRASKRATVFLK